ncbi:hypothetical protein HZA57_06285 [Candidatus Poribacteria bacterium]|nr:hypothetical protein [Candidatus Poribacteria bacterium]
MRDWQGQLEAALAALEKIAAEAPADITQPLEPGKAALARQYWGQLYDIAQGVKARADFHRDFVLWLKKERRADHVRAFLLCDVADLMVHDAGLRAADAMGNSPRWPTMFNEAQPEFGLPPGSFESLKSRIINSERTTRQFAAKQYLSVLRKLDDFAPATAGDEGQWLLSEAERLEETVQQRLLDRGIDLAFQQSKDTAGELAFKAWFPVQKRVANTMGDIKMKRHGVYLASKEQIAELRAKLQPGDIGVTRKNWYLSNAGIPGFWPHALLHLGTPQELTAFFDDPEVKVWCASRELPASDFPSYLAARHPKAWGLYAGGDNNMSFLEAVAAGVVFHPQDVTLGADCIGVVRPRLTKVQLAQAIDRAFGHSGKPYDYNFDFVTDSALVCSELVYKTFQPEGGFTGIKFPLKETLGRPLLPPTEIVKKFDLEWGSPGQQLDFVAFLDARESEGVSVWGTLEEFRHSWQRPKWSAELQ